MPFDANTPLGYMISMMVQTVDVYCLAICGYPSICFLIGGCWLWKTIMTDIANDLSHLKRDDSKITVEDRIEFKSLLCNIIRNVSYATQLRIIKSMSTQTIYLNIIKFIFQHFHFRFVSAYNDINEFIITVYFFWTVMPNAIF